MTQWRDGAASGAANAVLRIFGAGLSLAIQVAFARAMSPTMYGELTLLLAVHAIVIAIGCASPAVAAVRFVAEADAAGQPSLAAGAARHAIVLSLLASAVLAAVWAGVVHARLWPPEATSTAAWLAGAVMVVPNALAMAFSGVLQGLHRVVLAELLMNLLRGVALAVPVAVALMLARPVDIGDAITWNLAAAIVACMALAIALAVIGRRLFVTPARYETRQWLVFSASVGAMLVVAAVAERIDILMVGSIAGLDQAALYGAASRSVQILVFLNNAVAAVVAPRIAALAADPSKGNRLEMQAAARTTARLMSTASLMALGACLAIGDHVLALFGPAYVEARTALVVLVAGQAAASVFGPGAVFATFVGKVHAVIVAQLAGIAINVGLNFLLVRDLGMLGTAIAAATAATAIGVGLWLWIRVRFAIRIDIAAGIPRRGV